MIVQNRHSSDLFYFTTRVASAGVSEPWLVLCLCVSYDIIRGKLLNGTNVRAARSSQSSHPVSDRNVSPGLTIAHWPIYREEECGYKVFEAF